MRNNLQFYIDGSWVEPSEVKTLDVVNPADESVAGKVAIGSAADDHPPHTRTASRSRRIIAASARSSGPPADARSSPASSHP